MKRFLAYLFIVLGFLFISLEKSEAAERCIKKKDDGKWPFYYEVTGGYGTGKCPRGFKTVSRGEFTAFKKKIDEKYSSQTLNIAKYINIETNKVFEGKSHNSIKNAKRVAERNCRNNSKTTDYKLKCQIIETNVYGDIKKFKLIKKNQIAKTEPSLKPEVKLKAQTQIAKKPDPTTVIEHVNFLGSFNEPRNYPDGIKTIIKNCKKFYCIEKITTKKMAKIFSRNEKYNSRHPGSLIYGMAYFEIYYQNKIRKSEKMIRKFKENWPNKKIKGKEIVSLLKLNKARLKMRAALGMDAEISPEEAINRFWLLGDLLESGVVKKQTLSEEDKKIKKLVNKYKNTVSKYKSAIDKKKDDELYSKIWNPLKLEDILKLKKE